MWLDDIGCFVCLDLNALISGGAPKENKVQGSFACPDETTLFVGHVQSEVSATDDMPTPIELLIHILFDLLSHLLLIRTIIKRMADDMLSLILNLRLHLRVQALDSPLLHTSIHLI